MESPFFEDVESRPAKQAASFQGRLQPQEFMFQPASPATMVASASQSPLPLPLPLQSPHPSPSPTKSYQLRRSPRKLGPLGPVSSPDRVTKTTAARSRSRSRSFLAITAEVEPSAASTGDGDGDVNSPESRGTAPNPKSKPKPKPKRKRRPAGGYAPPSTYAHLPPLPDILAPGLLVLFVGLNPGLQTARAGHAYAHPSNRFWKLLHSSGVTPRLCAPSEDRELPRLYGLGNTNIVSRPSRNGAELSRAEMDEGVGALEDKVRACRPEAVCIVGKSIWESVWRVRHGRAIKKDEFRYGWQDEEENMGVVPGGDGAWAGAWVFVATSTSGLAATLRPAEKERIWRGLGEWCEKRRAERDGAV